MNLQKMDRVNTDAGPVFTSSDIRNILEERERLKRENQELHKKLNILRGENIKLKRNIIIIQHHLRRVVSVARKLGFKV